LKDLFSDRKLQGAIMFSLFEDELEKIDAEMALLQSVNIPVMFRKIPLEIFGKLLLDIPSKYPHIKAFFPTMASEEVQKNWTGTHGEVLLSQSLAFVKTMVTGYVSITGKKIENANILDYGCGWGRLIRLLYKFTSVENIYGVDPWDQSIKECEKHEVKANLALSDWVPISLPFARQFDLIFAFSVFTHLSEKTALVVLKTLRKYINDDGLLVISIRPKEYWRIHEKGILAPKMISIHDEKGFAFNPHHRPPINGDVTYGDTSISLAFFDNNVSQWKLEFVEFNSVDPYQVILFLKPG
jgi:2-polyprenyl-3-methyl-5-hydroxy-6-metoxy-1,4-benzoquinol methylase